MMSFSLGFCASKLEKLVKSEHDEVNIIIVGMEGIEN
jgi:hypothetical protein